MIDLHLHTTASDGRSTPDRLVRRAAAVGLRTIAVTDHDTVAGLDAARAAAMALGVTVISGIEITAIEDGRDVHLLGYLFDPGHPELTSFLVAQREDRRRRVDQILERLDALGVVISRAAIARRAKTPSGKAVGRPMVARALVAAGHARDIGDAFDRYLSPGRPAFVARRGATPEDVVALVGRAGGVTSFAHPGKLGLDHRIAAWAAAGLTAIEVFHPDHGEADIARYLAIAAQHGLAVSGGSDYHGPGSGRDEAIGRVTLPRDRFEALAARRPAGS